MRAVRGTTNSSSTAIYLLVVFAARVALRYQPFDPRFPCNQGPVFSVRLRVLGVSVVKAGNCEFVQPPPTLGASR